MAYYDDVYTTLIPLAHQDLVSFSSSSFEPYGHVDTNYDAYNVSVFHEPKSMDHGGYGYEYGCNYDYDNRYDYGDCHNLYSFPNPSINYLAHNYMESKLIEYEPAVCDTGYVSYHTQYLISYSKADSGFNEPEFEEYDPTPYGGGYDIVSVYGKPLPPSNQTCYPRSKPQTIGPGPIFNSNEPRPMPESLPETKINPKPEPTPIVVPIYLPEPEREPEPEPEPEPIHALVPVPDPLDLKEVGERKKEREEYSYPGYGYDYPWPEYDNAHATRPGYDYGYGKQVVPIPPCEYSPEVVDLCESIFGSWPCLARIRHEQQMGNDNKPLMSGPEIGQLDPWEDCARYIFGRPIASYYV